MSPGDELVEAAENLLRMGGSIPRRAALRQALERLPYAAPERQNITRHWPFTPPCLGMLARAASLAQAEKDSHIRLKHVEQALKETPG